MERFNETNTSGIDAETLIAMNDLFEEEIDSREIPYMTSGFGMEFEDEYVCEVERIEISILDLVDAC